MADCPTAEAHNDYVRDRLAPDRLRAVEGHLATCPYCAESLLSIGQDESFPVFERCRIIKELGSGRFGVVYKAWWLKDKPRLVALKCLSFSGQMERERFEREVKVLTQINSPSIVKCVESGVERGKCYYVMELIDGVHLDEFLEYNAGTLREKLETFQRVCAAVADAHASGVVHRDLKPRNILIDKQGQPRILDFGICSLAPDTWDSSICHTITRAGDIIGTLKYMSPEQAWGGVSGPVDERSDVWALGIMLYEIVTGGEYPFDMGPADDKPAHEALLERIRKELPVLPRLRNVQRGRHLEVLLERCLAWDPARRLGSAVQLTEDIGRYLSGSRAKTKPFSPFYRMHRVAVGVATKSRWAAMVTIVAVVALALAVTTYAFNVRWVAHDERSQGAAISSGLATDATNNLVVAGVYDDTAEKVIEFANSRTIGGVTTDVRTWRAVHGYVMQRLASAEPAALVWDYFFRTPQEGDLEFARGATVLQDSGIPVVLAAYSFGADGAPDLSPAILSNLGNRLFHGAIVARHMVELEGEFVLAIKRPDGVVIPSLALAAVSAVTHPEARLDIEWPGRNRQLHLLYETQPGSYLRGRDRVELTKVFANQVSQLSVGVGDLLACRAFELRRPVSWESVTIAYENLLNLPADELRATLEGKVVLIGDMRSPRSGFQADRHSVRYGRSMVHDVPGVYLIADAICGLAASRYLATAFLPLPATLAMLLMLAALGCVIPTRPAVLKAIEPPRRRPIVWGGLGALVTTSAVLMIWFESYSAVHLGMAGIALFLPMCGSLWVELARNRHRLLDRKRRSIESLQLEAERTLTMPHWRSKMLQAEQ